MAQREENPFSVYLNHRYRDKSDVRTETTAVSSQTDWELLRHHSRWHILENGDTLCETDPSERHTKEVRDIEEGRDRRYRWCGECYDQAHDRADVPINPDWSTDRTAAKTFEYEEMFPQD